LFLLFLPTSSILERSVVIQGSHTHKAVAHILLASISQVMIDKYYRSLEGFAMLVEKDWISFHYPFFGMREREEGDMGFSIFFGREVN
jgi:hypothetical protein